MLGAGWRQERERKRESIVERVLSSVFFMGGAYLAGGHALRQARAMLWSKVRGCKDKDARKESGSPLCFFVCRYDESGGSAPTNATTVCTRVVEVWSRFMTRFFVSLSCCLLLVFVVFFVFVIWACFTSRRGGWGAEEVCVFSVPADFATCIG